MASVPDAATPAAAVNMQQSQIADAEKANVIESGNSSVRTHSVDDTKRTPEDATEAALTPTQSRAAEFSKWRTAVIMLSLCIALFLAALDVTIITTALPTIAGVFHANSAGYTWVGSAYLLACAASTPLWGKASDIWGRKPALLVANVIFMIGSLIAALSVSIGMLIVARVVQGLGGGGLTILVYICVSDLFSMRDRGKWYGILGMVWAIASGVGPVMGGVFTEKVTWRWCFYINLPLDGISLVLLTFFLKLETPRTPFMAGIKAVDWLGVLTIVGGVICFLYGLESGDVTHPWDSAFVICLIVFGVVLFCLFLVNEWKLAKYPIMPMRLFKDTSNLAVFGLCFCHGITFIGMSYYLPLYFQTVLGATPILSGVYLFALVVPLSIASAASGIYIKKKGSFLPPLYVGVFFMVLGAGLFINLPTNPGWAKIIIYQIIAGIGVGPLFQSPLIALQSHLKGYDAAVGTATFGFTRNVSTSIGVVLGGVIFQNELKSRAGQLAQALGPQLARQFSSSAFGSTTAQLRALPQAQREAIAQNYNSSLHTIWIFYTCIAALALVLAAFVKKIELSTVHVMQKTGIEQQEKVRLEEQELRRQAKAAKAAKAAGGSKTMQDV